MPFRSRVSNYPWEPFDFTALQVGSVRPIPPPPLQAALTACPQQGEAVVSYTGSVN